MQNNKLPTSVRFPLARPARIVGEEGRARGTNTGDLLLGDSLAPLQLRGVRIDFPVVQAALSGYSDWPMRLLARRHGAGYAVCEVMLDQFLVAVRRRAKTKHFLYLDDEERPVGGQLMGAEPEQFAAGAKKLVEAGFDCIDINFGCPVKKVLGRCRGGFHLGQPDVALQIIERTRAVVPDETPVTVKMRRGIDDSQSSRDCFFRIAAGAYRLGVDAITVHGRTVEQRYVGPSNWDFLAEVKQFAGDRIVLGSGDLFTAASCLEMMARTGVDGVTVARGSDWESLDFRAGQGTCSRPAASLAAEFARTTRSDVRALYTCRAAV